jgi:hypothetical protein
MAEKEDIFRNFFQKFNHYISASKSSIEKPWKKFEEMGYPIILKQLYYFYVQQLTRKLLHKKRKKSLNFVYPPQFYF